MEEEKEVTSANPTPEPTAEKKEQAPSQFRVDDSSYADLLQSILARCSDALS